MKLYCPICKKNQPVSPKLHGVCSDFAGGVWQEIKFNCNQCNHTVGITEFHARFMDIEPYFELAEGVEHILLLPEKE